MTNKKAKIKYCDWKQDIEGESIYETKCGNTFQITDGGLDDNKMKYCCYCGKRINEVLTGSGENCLP